MSVLHKTGFPKGIENMGCRRRGTSKLDEVLESICMHIYMGFQEKEKCLAILTLSHDVC